MPPLETKTIKRRLPPLPDMIPDAEPLTLSSLDAPDDPDGKLVRIPRKGCYYILFRPARLLLPRFQYAGTLRWERSGLNTIASGDLYTYTLWPLIRGQKLKPLPSASIPIFTLDNYRYYLRVTQIRPLFPQPFFPVGEFLLGFELHSYDSAGSTWTLEDAFSARMAQTTAPIGYPSPQDYWAGQVRNSFGRVIGDLTMGWVSQYLRRAIIEIDKVSASEWPLDNGAGVDWRTIYNSAGWDISVVQSDPNVSEQPRGPVWNAAELHAEMLEWRNRTNLNRQWPYHVLCVREIYVPGVTTLFGIMYDNSGTDSNNVPREGAAVASHEVIPHEDRYGGCAGMRFGAATGPYFRSTIHEIGHAMNLYHPPTGTADNSIMQRTSEVADNALAAGVDFEDQIEWSHNSDDQKNLRHRPDIIVRPGGEQFDDTLVSQWPISPGDMIAEAMGLELEVHPLLEAVPLGAPVRVNFNLVNTTDELLPVPASLKISMGHIKGKVIDPSGTARTYSPIIHYHGVEADLRMLKPGQSVSHSLTLLRGAQGALFPFSGVHRIIVEVTWDVDGYSVGLKGETSVMVTPPVDEAHARIALKILSTPDALLTLVIGGDHLKEGIKAIQAGLGHPILRPHFALIEAKRLGRWFRKRKPDFGAVAKLLDETTVMSPAEIKRVAELVRKARKEVPRKALRRIAKTLRSKVNEVSVENETKKLVDSLWPVRARQD